MLRNVSQELSSHGGSPGFSMGSSSRGLSIRGTLVHYLEEEGVEGPGPHRRAAEWRCPQGDMTFQLVVR